MNSLAQALVQRGGYNPTDAINASTGPRAAELAREFGVSMDGGEGGGQIAQTGGGVVGQANQYLSQTYGEVQKGLSSVKARYEQLKNEITGRANTDVATE